ncbi:hypothetical protein PAMP_009136 [Pampus punctatissimus]
MLSCQACLVNCLLCGYADEGERPGPTAVLIGQAAGSSISFSKWRHVRPVRLQLSPDCFPEALEGLPLPPGPPRQEKGVSFPDRQTDRELTSLCPPTQLPEPLFDTASSSFVCGAQCSPGCL